MAEDPIAKNSRAEDPKAEGPRTEDSVAEDSRIEDSMAEDPIRGLLLENMVQQIPVPT